MSGRKPVTRESVKNKFTMIPLYFIQRGRYLTAQAKWVWVILRSFQNNKTETIFPSQRTIQELSGLSGPAVNKALRELEDFEWIIKHKKSGKSTNYKLNFDSSYNDPELEEAVTPIPTKEAADAYKKKGTEKRSAKDGTFDAKYEPKPVQRDLPKKSGRSTRVK